MTEWINVKDSLPACVANSFSMRAIQHCKDTGHVCPYWINDDIAEVLYKHDKENNTELLQSYRNQCHEIDVKIRPMKKGSEETPLLTIGCRRNGLSNIYMKCDYTNELAARNFLHEFMADSKTFFSKRKRKGKHVKKKAT